MNDSEMAANRKLTQDQHDHYEAFAESTRHNIHESCFKAADSTPVQVQYEHLISQLDSVTVVRHSKEIELAQLQQELKDLQRRSHLCTAPGGLKVKVRQTMLTLEFQLWDCDSYQHVRAQTQQSLQASKAKVCQMEQKVELIDRRLTDANSDLAAVTVVLEHEQSQLHLIEERSNRIRSQHATLITQQQASQSEISALVKRQQDALISKKFMAQEANKHISQLKTRLSSLAASKRSILMDKVVCILQLSRVKHNYARLTETFGTCEADAIIPKLDDFLCRSESLKTQIDDKVNCLSKLYMMTADLLHEQERVKEATSLSNLRLTQIAKDKEDILVQAELAEVKRLDGHLTCVCSRTEAMIRLAFNAVCALQSILGRVDQHDLLMLLGPRGSLPADLPQTLDADAISMLLSLTEQKLTAALTVASQANVRELGVASPDRVQRFILHSHSKLTRQPIRQRPRRVPTQMALLNQPSGQSPLNLKGSLSARSVVQGRAQVACKDTPTNLTRYETRTSLSRVMSSSRVLDYDKDDASEVGTFDRKQFKLNLRKNKSTQKVKLAVSLTQCTPRSYVETTARLMKDIDQSRAQLRLKSHTMSKPMSLQSREITRQLKQRLIQISSFRVIALPKTAEVKPSNKSRGLNKL
jgi:hypothetical protein